MHLWKIKSSNDIIIEGDFMNYRYVKLTKDNFDENHFSAKDIFYDIETGALLHEYGITLYKNKMNKAFLDKLANNIGYYVSNKEIDEFLESVDTSDSKSEAKTTTQKSRVIHIKGKNITSPPDYFCELFGSKHLQTKLYGYPITIEANENYITKLFDSERKSDKAISSLTPHIKTFSQLNLEPEDIANQLVKNTNTILDSLNYKRNSFLSSSPAFSPEFISKRKETFGYLTIGDNKIIGNYSYVAFSKEQDELIKQLENGTIDHSTLTFDNTVKLVWPGSYVLYILNFNIDKDYNISWNIQSLLEAFLDQIIKYSESGIFVDKVFIHLLDKNLKTSFEKLGFKHVSKCENNNNPGDILCSFNFPRDLEKNYWSFQLKTISSNYHRAIRNLKFISSRFSIYTNDEITEDHIKMTYLLDNVLSENKVIKNNLNISSNTQLNWKQENYENFIVICDEELNEEISELGNIVGYINTFPIDDNYVNKIKTGDFEKISQEDILTYEVPSNTYNLYIYSIKMRPGYSKQLSRNALRILIYKFIEKLYKLSQEGIYIKTLVVDVKNKFDEAIFTKWLQMDYRVDTTHDSKVYVVDNLFLDIKKCFDKVSYDFAGDSDYILSRLYEKYTEYYEKISE